MENIITVFMAVYNGEKYIKESIECILNQTYKEFELLIINDGSNDNTENIIFSFNDERIKYVKNEKNLGLNGTRIKGLNLIKSKYISIFDSDDLCLPNKLEKQIDYLEKNPDVVLCGTWGKFINEKSEVFGHDIMPTYDKNIVNIEMLFRNQFINPSVVYKTEVAKEVGGYEIDNFCEDYCLYSKISKKYKMANIPEFLTLYRIHDANMSITEKKDTVRKSEFQILEGLYDRFNLDNYLLKIPIAHIENNYKILDSNLIIDFFEKIISKNNIELFYEKKYFNEVMFNYWFKLIIIFRNKKLANSFYKLTKRNNYKLSIKQKRKLFKILINPFN